MRKKIEPMTIFLIQAMLHWHHLSPLLANCHVCLEPSMEQFTGKGMHPRALPPIRHIVYAASAMGQQQKRLSPGGIK